MIKKYTVGSFETNTYLIIKDNRCIIIDPTLDFKIVAEEIKKDYSVDKIFLTHGHLDHIDGAKYFDCPIFLYQDEIDFLFDSGLSLYNMMGLKSPFNKDNVDVRLLYDNEIVDVFGEEMQVLWTPGHTKGSCCYRYKNKLFSGDTLFQKGIGRTDFPTGNMKQMNKSLLYIIDLLDDNTVVYPGHGDKTTIREERKNNMYYLTAKKQ